MDRAFVTAPAGVGDLPAIRWILCSKRTPPEDFTPEHLSRFLVCRDLDGPVGVIGIEGVNGAALVRWFAVMPGFAGRGVGTRLIGAAEALASHHRLTPLLIWRSARSRLFLRLGFVPVEPHRYFNGTRLVTGTLARDVVLLGKP